MSRWTFEANVERSRQARLLGLRDFDEVLDLLAPADVLWVTLERARNPTLCQATRIVSRLRVPASAYDCFFNAPAGYRGQFARSVMEGEAANRRTLELLQPKILSVAEAQGFPSDWVGASIRGHQAKVWIDEEEVKHQLSGPEGINFARWKTAPPPRKGLRTPEGEHLEVKGTWLGEQQREMTLDAKRNRANEIFSYGFS